MKKCPCCNNKSYYKIFDFGLHPWCEILETYRIEILLKNIL